MSNPSNAASQRVLSERSPNTASPMTNQPDVPTTDVFKSSKSEIKASQEQTYVSPSDTILSPTSKKLSEIKGKRFANVKSRSLFAKTVSKEGLKSQEKLGMATR